MFSCAAQSRVSLIRQEVALDFGTLRALPVTVATPHGLFTCLVDFIISDEICSDVGLACDWFAFWKEYLRSEGPQVTTEMGDVLLMPVPSVFSFVIRASVELIHSLRSVPGFQCYWYEAWPRIP
jgi:hypothetical protein